jgi:hypothetical protein
MYVPSESVKEAAKAFQPPDGTGFVCTNCNHFNAVPLPCELMYPAEDVAKLFHTTPRFLQDAVTANRLRFIHRPIGAEVHKNGLWKTRKFLSASAVRTLYNYMYYLYDGGKFARLATIFAAESDTAE